MQSMSPEYVCEAQTSDGRDAEAIARRACGPRRDVPAASRPAHEPRPIPQQSFDQCAIRTGKDALARMWRVAPPKIICRNRL